MKLARATLIATGLVDAFAPACERIAVAGSIRRRAREVRDIELVAIPKFEEQDLPGQGSLFEGPPRAAINLLHARITELSEGCTKLRPIKPGSPAPIDEVSWTWDDKWPEKATGDRRYFRLWNVKHKIKIDVFLCNAETWGVIMTLRTGSAAFSKALVQHWTQASGGGRFEGRHIHGPRPDDPEKLGPTIAAPEEEDVFRVVGIEWVEPWNRRQASDVRRIGGGHD